MKLKALNKNLGIFWWITLILGGCFFPKKNVPTATANSSMFDPICGQEVIWHLHFQSGFDNDTISFIVNADTLPPITGVSSGNNGCTSLYLTSYEKEGETKVFIKNMPLFNTVIDVDQMRRDSMKIGFILNEKYFNIRESLKYNRFFGIAYNSDESTISYLRAKKCFGCW